MNSASEFYREVSGNYDKMTRFAERIEPEEQVFRGWKNRFGFQSTLDAACGTGLHAVVLARLGVRTTAADISPQMLDIARRHASEAGVRVDFIEADMTRLDERVDGPFDAVFCLGNSLPHLLADQELRRALTAFSRVLSPNGILGLQILNYDRVLTRQERIVGVSREGEDSFVRFYDFLEDRLRFNVLWIGAKEGKLQHRLTSTFLRPYLLSDLETGLATAGLSVAGVYGDLRFSAFDRESSGNLVVVGRKG